MKNDLIEATVVKNIYSVEHQFQGGNDMSTTEPIRNKCKLEKFRNYYMNVSPNERNYLLIITGLNTALRISDILSLKWGDIYDCTTHTVKSRIKLKEKKTGKTANIAVNSSLRDAIKNVVSDCSAPDPESYIFTGRGNNPMNRSTAYRIVKRAANYVGLTSDVSCHSLRKTFGYFAWKRGVQPAILMSIYNHSSFAITKRYLGIDQDDKDKVYLKNNL